MLPFPVMQLPVTLLLAMLAAATVNSSCQSPHQTLAASPDGALTKEQSSPVATIRVIDSGRLVSGARTHAQTLIRQGKQDEALAVYIATYRTLRAVRRASPESQMILSTLQSFGRSYPPAIEALRQFRDAAMQEFEDNRRTLGERTAALDAPPFTGMTTEIAILNQRLGDHRASIAFYDTLPPLDGLRRPLAAAAQAYLVELRRYRDAALGTSFGTMLNHLDGLTGPVPGMPPAVGEARATIIQAAARNIEVLTALRRADEVRVLMAKLFNLDNSDATRQLVQQHIARANQPPLPTEGP